MICTTTREFLSLGEQRPLTNFSRVPSIADTFGQSIMEGDKENIQRASFSQVRASVAEQAL
jgi:hypothetical protein